MIKQLIIGNKRTSVQKSSYFWNMCSGTLSAFHTVLLLVVITHVTDLYYAGIFTIAVANANLFANIGRYGMRNYQATDVKEKFNFSEYLASRYLTTVVMIVVSSIYIIFISYTREYDLEKTTIVLSMCLSRILDALEDVYYGYYQKQGRLDVAAKILTLRLIVLIVSFVMIIVLTKSLLNAIIVSSVGSSLTVICFVHFANQYFCIKMESIDKTHIFALLLSCFPLFLGTFLAFYIGNAPKYAIDAQLTEDVQACYGFISMPVFVVNLLNNFIFQPIMVRLAVEWNKKEYNKFVNQVINEILLIALLAGTVIAGGYLFGIPFLSALYGTDLHLYKRELMVLLLGGGMLALSGFFATVLTIMRRQRKTVWGYGVTAIFAYLLSPLLVSRYQIYGATILYLILMTFLSICFGGMIVTCIWKEKKEVDRT